MSVYEALDNESSSDNYSDGNVNINNIDTEVMNNLLFIYVNKIIFEILSIMLSYMI